MKKNFPFPILFLILALLVFAGIAGTALAVETCMVCHESVSTDGELFKSPGLNKAPSLRGVEDDAAIQGLSVFPANEEHDNPVSEVQRLYFANLNYAKSLTPSIPVLHLRGTKSMEKYNAGTKAKEESRPPLLPQKIF